MDMMTQTDALIATAREALSPHMYDAFLSWGEAAIRANIRPLEDDEDLAERESSSASAEVRRIGTTDAQNTHDLMFKTYLMALEAAECPSTGPLRIDPDLRSGYTIEHVIEGLVGDLPCFSPLCQMIDEWSDHAWTSSESRSTLTVEISAAMLEPFRHARAAPLPAIPTGYSAYMRAPLIQWQKAYARYEQANAELAAFDRDVHTPASRTWSTLGQRVESGDADPGLAAAYKASGMALDAAQERYDDLVSAEGDTMDALLSLPAPSASELATKLKIYSDAYGWGLCSDPSIGSKITADARRFGRHGAHLQTDAGLLTAYADRRRAFENAARSDVSTDAEDEAYFAHIDAAEEVMSLSNATTLEGVLAKLRIAFLHQVGEAWSDLAASDPSKSLFVEGVGLSDIHTRMAWSAIEDLARIGGISLSGQGR